MKIVFLTAMGVGGATVFGSVLGLLIKNISLRFQNILLSFCAGIMLCAAVLGLIIPSLDLSTGYGWIISTIGILTGALCIDLLSGCIPWLQNRFSQDISANSGRVLLFVAAIAIHNFPEGIAAGVSFGTQNNAQALLIAGGIALQNIPEGMVIIAPLLSIGFNEGKTFLLAFLTGVVEIIGTLLGYIAVSAATAILPFALAFAGGTMLHVICDEMIPDTHGSGRGATYSLLAGFCVMLMLDALLP